MPRTLPGKTGEHFHSRKKRLRAVLPIIGGMLIGILAALILRFVSGRFTF